VEAAELLLLAGLVTHAAATCATPSTERMMMTVVIATLPCVLMAMYNTGLQRTCDRPAKTAALEGWRHDVLLLLASATRRAACSPTSLMGAVLPAAVHRDDGGGAHLEVLFAVVRKVEVNEGFFVTASCSR